MTNCSARLNATVGACTVVMSLLLTGCSSSGSSGAGSSSAAAGSLGTSASAALPVSPSASESAAATGTSPAATTATSRTGLATSTAGPSSAGSTAKSYSGGSATTHAAVSIPSPATTAVPAPGGGNISQTVATGSVTTKPAVPLSSTASYGNGVTVTLAAVKKIKTTAELPGEVAGPGVALSVLIRNDSGKAVDVGNVVVDLQDSAGTPATAMSAAPASPLKGSLAAGRSITGVYVFTFPKTYRNPAHLTISYSAQAPVVLFTGTIS